MTDVFLSRRARIVAGWVWLTGGMALLLLTLLGYPLPWSRVMLWSLLSGLWGVSLLVVPLPSSLLRWAILLVDGGLLVFLFRMTGGPESPFLFLLYLKVVSLYGTHMVLWRFRTAAMIVLYGVLILLASLPAHPALVPLFPLLIHLGGIPLTGFLGYLLDYEITRRERDPLTRVWNRRMGFELLRERIRQGERLRLAFLDLDQFKEINDRMGHDAGDEVLRAVAQRLAQRFRGNDLVIRYGGDEFLIATSAPDPPARVEEAFREPVLTSGGAVQVGATVVVSDPITDPAQIEPILSQLDRELLARKRRRAAR